MAKPATPAGERLLVVGFRKKVHVVGLYGEVQKAKPRTHGLGECTPNFGKENLPTKTRQASHRAQRQVDRLPTAVRRACAMTRARPSFGAAARSLALAAPPLGKRQFSLR
jgi:hypothetical protein